MSVDQILFKAKSHSKKGEFSEAKKLYDIVLQKFPKNKRAQEGLTYLVSTKKKVPTLSPPQEVINQLVKLYNQGKLSLVADQIQILINQYPEAFILWNILGVTNNGLGRRNKALEAFKRVTEINPNYSDGFNNLGAALKDQGKLEEAIKAFEKALSLKLDFAEAHCNLGAALKDQGKLKEAIEAYKRSLSLKPDFAETHNNLGAAFKEQGELEKAVKSYRKALSLKPDFAEALNNLGATLQDQGKLKEAIGFYKKALSLKPDYADAHYNLGAALMKQGKLEEAIKAYKKAISIRPNYAYGFNNLGIALQDQGKLKEAIEAYNKALALKPDYAEAHYNLGAALKNQGKLEEAIEAYNKAISIKPNYSEAKHMLSALSGKKTKSAPKEYIQKLFDKYAANFEDSLVGKLEYSIPKILVDIVLNQHSNHSLGSLLDLGCGTGLTGIEIRKFCDTLEGIDLSNSMLEKARQKNVYDSLTHCDIVEYLSNSKLKYDYFIASDVFIYVGELVDVFRLIKTRNERSGKLVFSTEHTEKDGFHLEKTGRYSHSKSYITSLCREFGYTISHFSIANLRKERGKFLAGGLYILDF